MSVKAERRGGILTLTLDRPQKAHAYTKAMLSTIGESLKTSDFSVIIIQSTGSRAFCAGADLNDMKQATPADAKNLLSQAVFDQMRRDSREHSLKIIKLAVLGTGCFANGRHCLVKRDKRLNQGL